VHAALEGLGEHLSDHFAVRTRQSLKETVEALLVGHLVRAFDRIGIPDALPGSLRADLSMPLGAGAHKRVDNSSILIASVIRHASIMP
jgi:hypothetical protein